jgi:transposase
MPLNWNFPAKIGPKTGKQVIPIRREQCAKRVSRKSRWSRSSARRIAVAKQHGISEQAIYIWRKRFGGFQASDVRRLKQLEVENARLKEPSAQYLIKNDDNQHLITLIRAWIEPDQRGRGLRRFGRQT